MNATNLDLYAAVRDLRVNWQHWNIVERAEAVMALRRAALSVAMLAQIARCSTTSIRRLNVIAQLPPEFKARIRAGEAAGKFITWAQARRRLGSIP